MMKTKILSLAIILASQSFASENSNPDNLPDFEQTGNWIALPYAFTSDTTGLSGGVGAIAQGLLQPQTTFVGTLFYGVEQDIITNGNPATANFSGGMLSYSNFKLPYTDRFYLSAWGYMSHIPRNIIYLDGSNDSDKDDALTTAGDNNYFLMELNYVFPIGEGINNPDNIFKLRNGFAMERENYGDGAPFVTGRTFLGLKGFYQKQTIENWQESEPWSLAKSKPEWSSSGVKVSLEHDNTDYYLNPSRGYNFQVQYSTDLGWGDNLQGWDNIEFKYSKYFNLDTLSFTKQNVLALNFWTAYSPSWKIHNEILPGIDADRPPSWEGPRLGGLFRMRGYDSNRFSGKAAIYATAEYRAIVNWNPFKTTKILQKYSPVAVDWFQVVPFIEVGRVDDEYSFDLLKDLKYDAGISLRAFAAELPVRLDVGFSDEGVNMWVMIRQPFDF
ncbi:MAG: BamA/TamA family outer membrane protein [Campylobacterota bacterium]|nr:BamA/TamA family outer membrane protein [Campylobacterota bacterium]